MRPKVWTEVDLHPEALARLQTATDVITGGRLDNLAGVDAAIIGASRVDDTFLDRAGPHLKMVIRHGIGYNAVDMPAAAAGDILAPDPRAAALAREGVRVVQYAPRVPPFQFVVSPFQ